CKRSTSTCTWMGCCKIDRSRRSLNVEIGVLGVFAFYRLREMELWFASSPPYAARDVQAKDDKNPKARLVGDRRALRHSTPAPVRGSSRHSCLQKCDLFRFRRARCVTNDERL